MSGIDGEHGHHHCWAKSVKQLLLFNNLRGWKTVVLVALVDTPFWL